jgi:3-oxoacyl-[acyl-carrier protein] reductase
MTAQVRRGAGFLDQRAGLQGKTAVVLGGGGGMGAGITLSLAGAGVDVAFCDIDSAAVEATGQVLRTLSQRSLAAVTDVRDRAALDAFWTRVDEAFECVDIVINVVGGVQHKAFLESGPEDWDDNIRMNFAYVVQSCHHAASRMHKSARGGSIINITTIEGYRAAPGFSVYAGLKSGVANLSRSLGTELAPYGVRVNCIAPDQTPTPGLMKCIDPPGYDPPPAGSSEAEVWSLAEAQARNAIPLGRMGRIEDIENAVLFLASGLSCYISGQTLHVDGGAMASAGWYNFPKLGFRNRVPLQVIATAAYDEQQG